MENNKILKFVIYGGLVATALIIFLSSGMGKDERENAIVGGEEVKNYVGRSQSESASEQLEKKLESILSSMDGVGRVRVMITFKSSEEIIIASEEETTESESGASIGSRPVIIAGDDGENPIVLKELLPEIRGVVIIAQGASDISVRMNIISAASTVLGIKQSHVEVFEMNEKSVKD